MTRFVVHVVVLAVVAVTILYAIGAFRQESRCTHGESSITAAQQPDGTFKVMGPHATGCVR